MTFVFADKLFSVPRRMAQGILLAGGLPVRCRVVAWLLVFILVYRIGMPILYSMALAALPWLLLPSPMTPEGSIKT